MKGKKTTILTFAERCKIILASNWIGNLSTIKADAKGSKENIHSSKVMYLLRKGKPYIWVPEKDLHNVLPARVALTGDIVPLKSEKAKDAAEKLRKMILSEEEATKDFGYAVSGVLSSSKFGCLPRSGNLKKLLEGNENHVIYKFDVRSGVFVDREGRMHEVDGEDFGTSKADLLAPFTAALIDGINQSDVRRRALMLFCLVHFNANARDAYILSIDRKGFDVLGKVSSAKDGFGEYQWNEFRFTLKEEAADTESFCKQLVEMEEEVVKKVSSYSGIG